jgi:hypothetical protein
VETRRRISTPGALAIAVVLLSLAGFALWSACKPMQVNASGVVVVPQDCQSFELVRPEKVELWTDGAFATSGALTTWRTFGGGYCSAAFAFNDIPDGGVYGLRAGDYRGGFTQPRAGMTVEISWTAPGG